MHRIAISGLVALAAVLGGVAVPATAVAQDTTMAQPTAAVRPNTALTPQAAVGDGLSSGPLVSCTLTTDCLGVDGSSSVSTGGTGTPNRVARWNGSSWKGVGMALPKGTRSDDLLGVSCRGAKSCLVVGDYYTSTSAQAENHALALSYNGTSLRPTPPVPLPKGTTAAELAGVSCATATHCVAFGVADGNAKEFGDSGALNILETWNGARWTLHAVTTAAGVMLDFSGITCPTSAFCVVAGTREGEGINESSSPPSPLYLASWNGVKLTTMKPAAPGGSSVFAEFYGVSCGTPSNCAAVGNSAGTSATSLTSFTDSWNGKTWRLATVAWPKGTAESVLLDVSCYAARSCEAVGLTAANSAATQFDAAAVSFNGTAGTLQATPAPPKGYSSVFGALSCLPWGSCVAIGAIGKPTAKSAALTTGVWNGKAWKLDPGL